MADVKTIRIKGGKDEPPYIIINEEDFDEKTMELFVEAKKETVETEKVEGGKAKK